MSTTESFLRGKIAETITENETTPFTKIVSKVPKLTKGYITVSPDTDSEEIMYYDGVIGTPGEAGTINITLRGFNKENNLQDTNNQKRHTLNAEFKGALNHIIINNKADLDDAKFTGELRVPVFADATERDTIITTPEDGLLVYLQDVEDFASYKNGIWIIGLGGGGSATYYQDSTGDGTLTGAIDGVNTTFTLSQAPASPTAVVVMYNGIVQELGATDDYTITGLDIEFNTAPTSGKITAIYPDTPVGSGNSQTRQIPNSVAVNGELYRSTDDSSNLYYKDNEGDATKIFDNTTNKLNVNSASETEEGVVEKATDAEFEAGTDNIRYITSKQVKDSVSFPDNTTTYYSQGTSFVNNTTTTFTYTATKSGRYRLSISCTQSGAGGGGGLYIEIDGVRLPIWTTDPVSSQAIRKEIGFSAGETYNETYFIDLIKGQDINIVASAGAQTLTVDNITITGT